MDSNYEVIPLTASVVQIKFQTYCNNGGEL
jgi:hypothetical protein